MGIIQRTKSTSGNDLHLADDQSSRPLTGWERLHNLFLIHSDQLGAPTGTCGNCTKVRHQRWGWLISRWPATQSKQRRLMNSPVSQPGGAWHVFTLARGAHAGQRGELSAGCVQEQRKWRKQEKIVGWLICECTKIFERINTSWFLNLQCCFPPILSILISVDRRLLIILWWEKTKIAHSRSCWEDKLCDTSNDFLIVLNIFIGGNSVRVGD